MPEPPPVTAAICPSNNALTAHLHFHGCIEPLHPMLATSALNIVTKSRIFRFLRGDAPNVRKIPHGPRHRDRTNRRNQKSYTHPECSAFKIGVRRLPTHIDRETTDNSVTQTQQRRANPHPQIVGLKLHIPPALACYEASRLEHNQPIQQLSNPNQCPLHLFCFDLGPSFRIRQGRRYHRATIQLPMTSRLCHKTVAWGW